MPAAGQSDAESELRALDERQRQIIEAADSRAMSEIAHANLRINAPSNQVLTREQLLNMMQSGEIAAENFVRVPESVAITGDLGIVMGRETFSPTPNSASGRMFGTGPLQRRYTNIYVRESGRWLFVGRHANVIPQGRPQR